MLQYEKINSEDLVFITQDEVSRYYRVCKPNQEKKDLVPVIFSGGQMDHRLQYYLDGNGIKKDGLTKKSCFQYEPWVLYDPNQHIPYIRVFDYGKDPEFLKYVSTNLFANSIMNFIEFMIELGFSNFKNTYLYGISCGGINAIKAAKCKYVKKILAENPAIFGSILSRPSSLKKMDIDKTIKEKVLISILSKFINENVAFLNEYGKGYMPKILTDLSNEELNKINIIGGSIVNNPSYENNKLAQFLNSIQLKYNNNLQHDGIVTWLVEVLNQIGVNYVESKYPFHLDATKKENIELGMSLLHTK